MKVSLKNNAKNFEFVLILIIIIIISDIFTKLTYNISKLFNIFIVKFAVLSVLVYILYTNKSSYPLIVILLLFFVISIQNNMTDLTTNITENYDDFDLQSMYYNNDITKKQPSQQVKRNVIYNNNDCINPNSNTVTHNSNVCAGINKWDSGFSTQGLGDTITGAPSGAHGAQF
jgi:chromate transport protein ChrA